MTRVAGAQRAGIQAEDAHLRRQRRHRARHVGAARPALCGRLSLRKDSSRVSRQSAAVNTVRRLIKTARIIAADSDAPHASRAIRRPSHNRPSLLARDCERSHRRACELARAAGAAVAQRRRHRASARASPTSSRADRRRGHPRRRAAVRAARSQRRRRRNTRDRAARRRRGRRASRASCCALGVIQHRRPGRQRRTALSSQPGRGAAQDAAGDRHRSAPGADQARRATASAAREQGCAGRRTRAPGVRNPRGLRAARESPGRVAAQVGARGPELPLSRARTTTSASPAGSPPSAPTASATSTKSCRSCSQRARQRADIDGRGRRPAEAHLQHLAKDAAQGAVVRPGLRHPRRARARRHDRRLLRGARHRARPVALHSRRVRRLHRHAEGQSLSLAAHRRDRSRASCRSRSRSARARCTSTPSSASPRTGATRKAARANPAYEQKIVWLRQILEPGERGEESEGDFLERVRSGDVRGSRLRALAARRSRRPAARRDAARLRLSRAHRSRSSLPRRQGQRPHGAAEPAARERRSGRDHHRQAAQSEPRLARARRSATWSRRATAARCAPGSASSTRTRTGSRASRSWNASCNAWRSTPSRCRS